MLELASLQPWCHGNKQRLHMLIICRPLSVLAFRLARATGRHEGHRAVELRAIARIMMRCFNILALRIWRGTVRNGETTSEKSSHSTGCAWDAGKTRGQLGHNKRRREERHLYGIARQDQLGLMNKARVMVTVCSS